MFRKVQSTIHMYFLLNPALFTGITLEAKRIETAWHYCTTVRSYQIQHAADNDEALFARRQYQVRFVPVNPRLYPPMNTISLSFQDTDYWVEVKDRSYIGRWSGDRL